MLKKKIWANFQRIVEVFTQKIFNMLSNIWVWDPGSGKFFRIPDPGVKKAPDPGSGSATLVKMYRQKVISKIIRKKNNFLLASWKSLTKRAGSGSRSVNQVYKDSDP
jgi:hypothetical protein